jgi:hypothetical protein
MADRPCRPCCHIELPQAASPYAAPYFCLLAAVGGFLLVQLFLAVLSDTFISLEAARAAEEEAVRRQPMAQHAPANMAEAWTSGAGSCSSHPLLPQAAASAPQPASAEGDAVPLLSSRMTSDTQSCLGSYADRCLSPLTRLVQSSTFNNVSIGCVVFNVFIMCLEYRGESAHRARTPTPLSPQHSLPAVHCVWYRYHGESAQYTAVRALRRLTHSARPPTTSSAHVHVLMTVRHC